MTGLLRAGKLLLPALFFLCLLFSRQSALDLASQQDLRTLVQESAAFSGKAAQEMHTREKEEEQPLSFLVWGQQRQVPVQNPALGRTAVPDALTLCGDSNLLLPSSAPLLLGDREGCLIDKATAQSLFGDPSPIGSILKYGDRMLTVRGIVSGDSPIFMVQALPEDETVMDRVTLHMPAGVSAQKALAEFENRHSLSGSWLPLRFWSDLAGAAALLAPVALLLSVVLSLLKTAFSASEFPLVFLICLLGAGAVWFLLLWITGFSFRIPEEFVPTKWSDFDFWARLWEQKKAELILLLSTEKLAPDLRVFLPSLKALGFGLAALLLSPLSLGRIRPNTERGLWIACASFFALAFLGTLSLGGGALAKDQILWLCPAAYLVSSFLSHRLREWADSFRNRDSAGDSASALSSPSSPRTLSRQSTRGRRFRAKRA